MARDRYVKCKDSDLLLTPLLHLRCTSVDYHGNGIAVLHPYPLQHKFAEDNFLPNEFAWRYEVLSSLSERKKKIDI